MVVGPKIRSPACPLQGQSGALTLRRRLFVSAVGDLPEPTRKEAAQGFLGPQQPIEYRAVALRSRGDPRPVGENPWST